MTAASHSTKVNSTLPVNLEVEMDHYSLELLAKLHHKGLVNEGMRTCRDSFTFLLQQASVRPAPCKPGAVFFSKL